MADHRPGSGPTMPINPAMKADLRNASAAMQRAAEAMIAATDSFRQQFHGQDQDQDQGDDGSTARPYTYHGVEAGGAARVDMEQDGRTNYRTSGPISSTSNSSSASVQGPLPSHPPVLPQIAWSGGGSGGELDDIGFARDPKREKPEKLRVQTGTPRSPPSPAPPPSVRTTSAPQWRPSATTSSRSSAAHVDLVEAAERFRQNSNQYPTDPPAQQQFPSRPPLQYRGRETALPQLQPSQFYQQPLSFPPATLLPPLPLPNRPYSSEADDSVEPSPILQIGRYTYIRSSATDLITSTEDFQTTLLTGEHRPSRHPSSRLRPHALRPHPRPKAPSSRPAGLSATREVLFVLLICLAQVLMLAGIAQALVPAGIIGASFRDTTPGSLAWFSAAYGLTAGTFVLPAGRLGDLFGHKRVFVSGFVWFGLWSVAAGFAGMVEDGAHVGGTVYFCFCRAMQGIGPALLVPNGQAMLGRTYVPGRRKNMIMSLFGAAAPLGFVVGAVMSSLLAEKASWPWGFWCMGAVCGALAAVSVVVIPGPSPTAKGRTMEGSLWTRLDGSGIVLGVSGLVLFNFAFNQAPIVSWTTPYVYFILLISALLLGAFVYAELRATHPLVPIAAMRAQTNFVLGCTAAGWGCFSIWVYYALAILQNQRHWSPLLSSAAFAHAPLSGFAASMLTGYLMGKMKPHWIMFISMCAFFVGSVLLATAPVEQSYWYNTFFGILVMPFGMDMSNPAATIILSNSVPKEHQGIAASLVVTVVNYSISLALGIGGTVEVSLNDGGADPLAGYRGAQYLSVGLGGFGMVLAAAFLAQSYSRDRKLHTEGRLAPSR